MVEFIISTKDLKHAVQELSVNRGSHADPADILVSQCVASFCAVGTETDVPVTGKRTGSVRLPFPVLKAIAKVAPTFKDTEVTVVCEPGILRMNSWASRHPGIELRKVQSPQLGIPIDLPSADILALARLLSPEQLIEQGLRERVEAAQASCSQAIGNAAAVLREFSISEKQISGLVEEHIAKAGDRLRRVLTIC